MTITLYMTAKSTEVLGPYKRYALWVQGCNKHCPRCISPDAQPLTAGTTVNVEELVSEIVDTKEIEGITISGGEPFLQQDALCELIQQVRAQRDIGVIVYTGMKYDEIKDTALAKNADIIIDGEYVDELNDDKSLRGSSNQNVICVTARYKSVVSEYYGVQGRKVELSITDGATRLIGIPSKDFKRMIGV